jgi:replicative DNA helicase
MALYFAVQAWKQGKSPLVISLEMSETEVRNRVFTIMGDGLWSHRKLSDGQIDIDDLKRWHKKDLSGKPEFHIISNDSGGDITPSVIRGKIDQYKPDLIIVDYLQLMSPNQKSDNETVRMKNLSRELKLLAISEEIPIIAISSATPDDVNKMMADPAYRFDTVSNQIRDIFNKEPQSELIPLDRTMRQELAYSMQQLLVDKSKFSDRFNNLVA